MYISRILPVFFLLVLTGNHAIAQTPVQFLDAADSLYYSDPDSSYVLCVCAEKKAVGHNEQDQLARARLCKARYLILKSEYEQASIELNRAIDYLKRSGDKNRLASAYNSKAILLERLGNQREKYEYQNEAVRLYQETGNAGGMSKMLNNLANSYIHDKRFKEASECLDRILMLLDKLEQHQIYFYYQNSGVFYLEQQQYEKALVNLETALKIAREEKMLDSEITAATLLGKVYTGMEKYVQALQTLDDAKKLALKNDLVFELSEIYAAMIGVYTAQEKYKQAYETLVLQQELDAKTNDLESIHRINQRDKKEALRQEYESSVKGLEEDKQSLEGELRNLQACKWILFSVGMVLLVTVFFLVRTIIRQKRRIKGQ